MSTLHEDDEIPPVPKLTPSEAGNMARRAYIARCEQLGRQVDPVLEDEEYWRAYRAAQGRQHYAGD